LDGRCLPNPKEPPNAESNTRSPRVDGPTLTGRLASLRLDLDPYRTTSCLHYRAGHQAEARAALRQFVASHSAQPERVFGYLMGEWLDQVARSATPSPLAGHGSKVRGRFLPALGHLPMSEVTPRVVELQLAKWADEGLSPATVRQLHDLIRSAWQQGVLWGVADPAMLVVLRAPRVRREDQQVPDPPAPEQLAQWIATAFEQGDHLLGCAVTLAATTGMRRGELVALRWSDVDLGGATLRVGRSITRVSGHLVEGGTKTHRCRTLALDPTAVGAIRTRQSLQRRRALEAGLPLFFDPYLLPESADGAMPVSPDELSHRWYSLCEHIAGTPSAKERADSTTSIIGPRRRWGRPGCRSEGSWRASAMLSSPPSCATPMP